MGEIMKKGKLKAERGKKVKLKGEIEKRKEKERIEVNLKRLKRKK